MIQRIKNYDFILLVTPVLLAGFGAVMIYSASMVSAVVEGLESTYYLYRQLQWFGLGLIGFVFCCIFPYQYYQRLIKPIVLICIILLISVLLFGHTAQNATRALRFGAFSIQPSEFAKLGLILYLASIYSKKQLYIDDFFKAVLPPLILTSIILALIIKQPDLGTSMIILLIAGAIIFSSGIKFKHLFTLIGIAVVFLSFIIPKLVTKGRIDRIVGAYQPFEDPGDVGHHLIQSYLAIGGGGLTGEGLGQSIQKLGYLWGAHTDFIMSVIAEELGLLGVVVVIGMLALIVLRGMFMARKSTDSFGALLAIGISSMIAFQTLINLGSISGILPITGVPLPFISYGGSSLLILMISMGILNNIAMTIKKKEQEPVRVNNREHKEINHTEQLGGKAWLS